MSKRHGSRSRGRRQKQQHLSKIKNQKQLIEKQTHRIVELNWQRMIARDAVFCLLDYVPDNEWACLLAKVEQPDVAGILKSELSRKRLLDPETAYPVVPVNVQGTTGP